MKIYLLNASTKFFLCNGNDSGEHPEDFVLDGQEAVQVEGFLRAARSQAFARGNTATSVSFRVTKEHADAQAAEEYIATHHGAIPKTGALTFVAESAGGGGANRTLGDAALKATRRSYIGCTSIFQFEFVGGDYT